MMFGLHGCSYPVCQRKCDRLSVKATRLVSTLEDQNLEGMELQSAVDEVILYDLLDLVHRMNSNPIV